MNFYCVPADFRWETLCRMDELNQKYEGSSIAEVYGQLSDGSTMGSGRAADHIPRADRRALENYVLAVRDRQILFNYTMNSTCLSNREFSNAGQREIRQFLTELYEMGVESLTVALPSLIELIQSLNYKFQIKSSVICQAVNPGKVLSLQRMGVDRVVLDESIHRDFHTLRAIQKSCGDSLELIVNVVCHKYCVYRPFHHNQMSHDVNPDQKSTSFYSHRCLLRRFDHPGDLLRLTWIRPEDLIRYTEIGYHYFKIQGRQAAAHGDLIRTVEHYMAGGFRGNLLLLLDAFSPTSRFQPELDNRKLEGFLDRFADNPGFCTNDCANCGYCDRFAERVLDVADLNEKKQMALKFYSSFDEYPAK